MPAQEIGQLEANEGRVIAEQLEKLAQQLRIAAEYSENRPGFWFYNRPSLERVVARLPALQSSFEDSIRKIKMGTPYTSSSTKSRRTGVSADEEALSDLRNDAQSKQSKKGRSTTRRKTRRQK